MKKPSPSVVRLRSTDILSALLVIGCLVSLSPNPCWALVYCNVTDVQTKAIEIIFE